MCLAEEMEEGDGGKHNPRQHFHDYIDCRGFACSLGKAVEGFLYALTENVWLISCLCRSYGFLAGLPILL